MRSKSTGAPRAPAVSGRIDRGGRPGASGTAAPTVPPGGTGPSDPLSLLLDLLVLALAAGYLVMLWRQASPAMIASDECFHAYLAEWIARHGRLPHVLPEFYSGLPYFYPPLFHVLGAVAIKMAGPDSLKVLNVVLTAGLVAVLHALPVPGLPRFARRCAILLCLASPALSFYAVSVYAETLATLMAVLFLMLLLRARARPGVSAGVLLGLALGASLLAKQTAVMLPLLLAVLAVLDLVRRRRRLATTMLVALGIGTVAALPFFVRNAVLFGSPFYPPITNNAQVMLDAMNTRFFSLPAPMFYRKAMIVMGPVVPWLAGVAFAWNLARRRFDLVTGLLAGCIAFTLLMPWVPRFQPRHLNPVTAMAALLGSLALVDVAARRRWVALVTQTALLVWATVFVARMGGQRAWLDASAAEREVYRAVATFVPAGGTVLSRSTYDTFYYARRNATWPIPWGETAGQIDLFDERDPARFLATLDRLSIGYLLVPRRTTARRFNGTNYPQSFIDCVATLVERGRLRVLWGSDDMVLVGPAR